MNMTITDINGHEYYYENAHVEYVDDHINIKDIRNFIIAMFIKRNIIKIERNEN